MEIYLIRHTTPNVMAGTCYGQADLDVTESFEQEASIIKQHLPENILQVYTSPLQRCRKLAGHLFPEHALQHHDDLKEISCGEWELKLWNDIPQEILMPWMNDFVNVRIPGGESYTDLYERVVNRFNAISNHQLPAAIVSHGGVMRSILSHLTQTPLIESFNVFKLNYGCVVKLQLSNGAFAHEILSNIPSASEQHKPSYK
jgi:alpha-ribazole phosphatase